MKKNQTREKIDEIKEIILDYLSYRHVMNFAEIELIFDLFGIDWLSSGYLISCDCDFMKSENVNFC